MTTGLFWDERCFWHAGEGYAGTYPLGGHVQPLSNGGLPESPESKRRLKSLVDVTGLGRELVQRSAPPASREELERVHPADFLDRFQALSDDKGGELGLRTPFGKGGFEIAALSAGLARGALFAVLEGEMDNAYALSGPREVASLMLSFEDGDNLASVWSASISQVVENQNQPDLDKVRRKLEPGIARALRVLPDAPTP